MPPNGSGSDEFRLEEFVPYRLSIASHRVVRLFSQRYADQFGLSIPEWRVLAVVGRYGGLSPTAVGDKAAMDKVKVSRAASGLSARGLMTQSTDPKDGRGKILRLTRKGAVTYRDIVPLARETEAMVSAGVTRSEWAVLDRVLTKLNGHLEKSVAAF